MKGDRRSLWIVKQNAASPDMAGGTRQYEFARALVQRGYQVTIIATSFSYLEHREVKLKPGETWKIEEIDGVRFAWLRSFPYQKNDWRRVLNILGFAFRLNRLGRRLPKLCKQISAPDVVMAFSVPLFAPLAASVLARHFRVPFIMEVGDFWPQTLVDMGLLSERSLITQGLRILERFLYRRASRIITSLPSAQEYLSSLGIAKEKIILIPNGIDPSRFDGTAHRKRDDGSFVVMYVGAHGPANDLSIMLEGARTLQREGYREIRFVLVGDGQEKPRLQALAKEMQVQNVEFRPPVAKNQVPEELKEADAFVLHLKKAAVFQYGVSSNKLFDYMAAGRPVIFSVGSSNNPVAQARCGLTVPPQDPKALAQAVLQLYRMPEEERRAMGLRGREYIEKHHAIPVLADQLARCIEELLSSQHQQLP